MTLGKLCWKTYSNYNSNPESPGLVDSVLLALYNRGKRLKSQSLNSNASTSVLNTAQLSKTRTYCSLCRDSFCFGNRPNQREMHILCSLWGLDLVLLFCLLNTEVIRTGRLIIPVYQTQRFQKTGYYQAVILSDRVIISITWKRKLQW